MLSIVMLACDPDHSPQPAPPPPPDRVDTLLGTYIGDCIITDQYLDFMTGQQITTIDTQLTEIKLLGIDTISTVAYHFQFEGTYFADHTVGAEIFEKDTLTMHFLFGTHTENISMIPTEGLIITYDAHNNPSGFGSTTRRCRCLKPL